MKKKIIRGLLLIVLGFVLVFAGRFGFGLIKYPPGNTEVDNFSALPSGALTYSWNSGDQGSFYMDGTEVSNYASSSKQKSVTSKGGGMQIKSVDQKYEKVANMTSASKEFEKDEKKLRKTIDDFDALVQYERSAGMPGSQSLYLTIGVDPAKFDSIIPKLKAIGKLQTIQVNKKDKTNEFLNLQAKLATLEKTRNSYIEMKSRSGTIRELIDLEANILSIEEQIQGLGVNLGKFDEENEFCTVQITLNEYRVTIIPGIAWTQRMSVAFDFSVKFFGSLMMFLLISSFSIWLIIKIVEKMKWLPGWIKEKTKGMK